MDGWIVVYVWERGRKVGKGEGRGKGEAEKQREGMEGRESKGGERKGVAYF